MAVNVGDNVGSDSEDPSFLGSDHDDSSSEDEVDRLERLVEEVRMFVAHLIIMNDMVHVHVPPAECFQSQQQSKWFAHAPGISQIFSRDRFIQLKHLSSFLGSPYPTSRSP